MSTNIVARLALVALVCGIACDAGSDEVTVETEQVAEPAEGNGESLADEDQFRVSWSCILQPEEEEEEEEEFEDIYCLAKCKGYKWTRAVKNSVDVKELTDYWCEKRAKRFCDDVGREFDDWCWGVRD